MIKMNDLLTPRPGYIIVGTAEYNIVFHIEGNELSVFKIGEKVGNEYKERRCKCKDNDFGWYLNEHVGIHKIEIIWQQEVVHLTNEDCQRIEQATDKDMALEQLVDNHLKQHPFDENTFIRETRTFYEDLMTAYYKLCEIYSGLKGTKAA